MTKITIKSAELIKACDNCILSISQLRKKEDKNRLEWRVSLLKNKNKFWNKLTFGLFRLLSDEELEAQAIAILESLAPMLPYPDTFTYGKWECLAEDLKVLAEHSHNFLVEVDETSTTILNWRQADKE